MAINGLSSIIAYLECQKNDVLLIPFCAPKSLGYEKYFIKIVTLIIVSKLVSQADFNLILVRKHLLPQYLRIFFSCKIPFIDLKRIFLLKREISELILKFYSHINLNVILKNSWSIGSFFRNKDIIPELVFINVVYKYSCA